MRAGGAEQRRSRSRVTAAVARELPKRVKVSLPTARRETSICARWVLPGPERLRVVLAVEAALKQCFAHPEIVQKPWAFSGSPARHFLILVLFPLSLPPSSNSRQGDEGGRGHTLGWVP